MYDQCMRYIDVYKLHFQKWLKKFYDDVLRFIFQFFVDSKIKQIFSFTQIWTEEMRFIQRKKKL